MSSKFSNEQNASDARLNTWTKKIKAETVESQRTGKLVESSDVEEFSVDEEIDLVNNLAEDVGNFRRTAFDAAETGHQSSSEHEIRTAEMAAATTMSVDRFGFLASSCHASKPSKIAGKGGSLDKQKNMIRMRKNSRRAQKWLAMMSEWSRFKNSQKLKNRCRKGIPDEIRAMAWMKLTGAEELMLQHEDGLYDRLVDVKEAPWEKQILLDVDRTFPQHVMYAEVGGEGQRKLFRVLRAYSLYDPDLGYCQGLAFVVGFLCTYLLEKDCFWLLCAIMNGSSKYALTSLYAEGMPKVRVALSTLDILLEKACPRLSKCLYRLGISSHMYATSWFMSIFTSSLPFAVTVRIWDMFLCEGWKTLYRVALALLSIFGSKTTKNGDGLDFATMLRNIQEGLPEVLNQYPPGKLVRTALKIRLTSKLIEEVEADATDAWGIERI